MRKAIAIIMTVVVGASCISWLRHQPLFSVLLEVTAAALFGILVFGGARALFVRSTEKGLRAESGRSGWWSPRFRNLSLGAAFVLLLILTVPHFVAMSSGAYKLAVATANQSPQFREALGVPVTESWFSEGQEEWGTPAKATLMVPVRGRKRQGNLRALAVKETGTWKLTELTLELTQPDDHIDLLRH